jgi:alkanesulfonate monooxygenase SsuD/methylene tetrahydromethanopterin reductase-like flavin-dependent oxidoreductase (luciferase family)
MHFGVFVEEMCLPLGTAFQVLPVNHPLRIAEEIANVGRISKGRFECGIGRSGVEGVDNLTSVLRHGRPRLGLLPWHRTRM